MTVCTHPLSQSAGNLFDAACIRLGVVGASRWMFSGHEALGGRSPLQAIKLGRDDDARRLLLDLTETP